MHSTLGASIYRPQSLGPKNEGKNTDSKKPKISTLILADVETLRVHCHGSTFGATTLNFSCPYNVVTLGFNVLTFLFGVATLHFGCLYNVATLNFSVATLL